MRRRYVHRPGHPKASDLGMVAVEDLDASDGPIEAPRPPLFTDRYMEGVASPVDGSDIGSRTKRREHMKIHGLVDADDYKQEWAAKAQKREAFLRTGDNGRDWVARFEETHHRLNSRRK